MEISLLSDSHLRLDVKLVREEPQPYNLLLDSKKKGTSRLVTICSWCKNVKTDHEEWVDIADALDKISLIQDSEIPTLTHGMCPPCFKMVTEKYSQTSHT